MKQIIRPISPILIATVINFFWLTSCDFPNEKVKDEELKQWIYVELVTESATDTTEYFYFGQVRKSLTDQLATQGRKSGLFTLHNIRFWNDDDLLELYEDETFVGSKVFKIQDIEEVTLYKDDPVNLMDIDQLHDSAKKIRSGRN